MESLGVLLTFPMNPYLEGELDRRCKLFHLWEAPPGQRVEFLRAHARVIRAVVGNATYSADAEIIDALPGLEIVACFCGGLDNLDLRRCRERGIRVTDAALALTEDVADVAIWLAVAVLRRARASSRYLRTGAWKTRGDFEMTSKFSGKSVGIVGLGRIGLAVAKRAEACGCPVSYHSRSRKPGVHYKFYPSVVELAANSEVLVVACSLTEETRHIIDRRVIDALGPRGVLVNVARGAHVDEAELVSALLEGRLGGAGLDVFEREPEVPEGLLGLDNVALLPHVGSGTWESRREMADLVLGNLEAHVLNEALLTPVL